MANSLRLSRWLKKLKREKKLIKNSFFTKESTLGQNPTFYPKNPKSVTFEKCEFSEKLRFWKCEFYENWDFENVKFEKNENFEIVNFVKNDFLKKWILWKMRFSKCEFCIKKIFKILISGKLRFQKCELCKNWDFKNVNFVKIDITKMWIM